MSNVSEREPMTTVVCGMTGVGKTHETAREALSYLMNDPKIGRHARKVLAFDMNEEDAYKAYKQINPADVPVFTKQKVVEACKIGRIKSDRTIMDSEEIKDAVQEVVQYFKGGLFIIEDIDKYLRGAKSQSVVSILTANRHSDLDIIIQHQSMSKITTTEWENMTILRLHHQIDDPNRYKSRIPNPELIRIARFIVHEQYNAGNERFFLYIDVRRSRISIPTTKRDAILPAFKRACKRYLDEENSVMKSYMQIKDSEGATSHSRETALEAFVQDKIKYIQ